MLDQLKPIECDFTAPEISLGAFYDYETGETLVDMVTNSASVAALVEARNEPAKLNMEDMADLEWESLVDIGEAVRRCVKFAPGIKPWKEKPAGDCYTFTWLISDLAEKMGYKSFIAFCNGHAFNLIVTPSGATHMLNGESRHMWVRDIDDSRNGIDMLDQRIWEHVRSSTIGDYSYHSMYSDGIKSFSDREKPKNIVLGWLEDKHPAITIMSGEVGKQALFTYACLENQLYTTASPRAVLTTLQALEGCNPQVETRQRVNQDLRVFKRLVKIWASDPRVSTKQIQDVIDAYGAIMPQTKSMLLVIGDCQRQAGETRQDFSLVKSANSTYVLASKKGSSANDPTLRGKINKTLRILDQISRSQPQVVPA